MSDSETPELRFFRAGSGYGNVLPNRSLSPEDRLPLFARRFHRAGQQLAESMLSKGGYNDIDACPVVFLYRHALELYLKGAIRCGVQLSQYRGPEIKVAKSVLYGHPLSPLLQVFRRVFEAAGWTWESDLEELSTFADFEQFVSEFDEIDGQSFAFRYSMKKDGKDSLPLNFVMNLPEFCKLMDSILSNLDGVAIELDLELQALLEGYSELGEEMGFLVD